ncbi:hypothetical protein K32_18270 [Kaistia sp. 32K]|nr:hypothetical protein K32_18270 [Kaistia sp. 32K]
MLGEQAVRAYVINLDRAQARLAAFDAQARGIGLCYERIRAVEACSIAEAPEGMLPTAVACFHSHRLAWRKIAESGDAWGAVFEDDVLLSASLAGLLAEPRWIPRDASVIKLETVNTPTKMGRRGRKIAGCLGLHDLLNYHSGAGGYLIRADAAKLFLALSETIERPVDDVLFDLAVAKERGLRVLQMVPAVCVQDRVLAEIDGRAIVHETQMQTVSAPLARGCLTLRQKLGREALRLPRQLGNVVRNLRRGIVFPVRIRVPFER